MLQAMIGGVLKGTKLVSLSGTGVRPTAARVREAVFNILQHQVRGATFIDLFAGNGAMGLEAVSRGARAVRFVEKDPKAIKVIKTNIDHCKSRYEASDFAAANPWPATEVEPRDAFKLAPGGGYDIVWLDPPYALYKERAQDIVALAKGLAQPEGTIVFESDFSGAKALTEVLTTDHYLQRRYGKSVITTLSPPPAVP